MPIDIKSKFIDPEMTTDTELAAGLTLKQSLSAKNQPGGYAGLDAQGKILSTQIPNMIYETSEVIDGGNPSSSYLTQNIDGGAP